MYEAGDLISSISKNLKFPNQFSNGQNVNREHGIESFKAQGKNMKYSPEFNGNS